MCSVSMNSHTIEHSFKKLLTFHSRLVFEVKAILGQSRDFLSCHDRVKFHHDIFDVFNSVSYLHQ